MQHYTTTEFSVHM